MEKRTAKKEGKTAIKTAGDAIMPTIYISGAITNDPDYRRKFALAENVLKQDHPCARIINPANNEIAPFGNVVTPEEIWEAYMEISREQVKQSDIVATLPGWEQSRGAVEEVALAKSNGILVCSVRELIK